MGRGHGPPWTALFGSRILAATAKGCGRMVWMVGVDIGGTFADFAALDTETGGLATLKVLTTPDHPGRDVAAGLQRLAADGLGPRQIVRVVHGTTGGVNTIIQRPGVRLALFTTARLTR